MDNRHHFWFSLLLLAAMLLSGCNLPGMGAPGTTISVDAVYTSAALTLNAQLTQVASTPKPPSPPEPTLPEESPLAPTTPPTDTPLPFTETPTLTSTPAMPLISASVATNCRPGPSKVYEPVVGVLAVGQKATVHGRNSAGTWWYIENPRKPGTYCWVWGETTKVEGDTASLPIITPPPPPPTATATPTPGVGFSASFETVHDCGGTPTAIFKIVNNGGVLLHSMTLKIDDLTDSTTLFGPASSDAPFMGTPGECPPGGDVLNVGKTLYVGGAIGAGHGGHSARATIKLCTENGLGGTCVERTVNFTIP